VNVPSRLFVAAAALLALLAGCSGDKPLDPPDIRFGQDTCAECGMIVSDERFAGAIVYRRDREVQHALFDDVGEMLTFTPPHAEASRWWVRDAQTRAWVDADAAHFVVESRTHTPMGTGVLAFASSDDADRAITADGGQRVDLAQAKQALAIPAASAEGSSAAAPTTAPASHSHHHHH
jgi:copper chaperone NosL